MQPSRMARFLLREKGTRSEITGFPLQEVFRGLDRAAFPHKPRRWERIVRVKHLVGAGRGDCDDIGGGHEGVPHAQIGTPGLIGQSTYGYLIRLCCFRPQALVTVTTKTAS
jgi:hypothetical protein